MIRHGRLCAKRLKVDRFDASVFEKFDGTADEEDLAICFIGAAAHERLGTKYLAWQVLSGRNSVLEQLLRKG